LAHAGDDVIAAVAQVLRVGAALAAIADNGDALALEGGAAHFVVGIDLHQEASRWAVARVCAGGGAGVVTAPCAAEATSAAYVAKAPVGWGRAGVAARRPARSAEVSIVRARTSMATMSPSARSAIGPPTAASGETWPATKP